MKLFLPLLLAAFLFGCAQNNNAEIGVNSEQPADDQAPRQVQVKNSEPNDTQQLSMRESSRLLADTARRIPGVQDATAVTWGSYAVVGIDVDANLDRTEVGSIKYAVAEGLKDQTHGKEAVVVADPDLYARLKEVGQDMENGQPLEGIANELADIAGRAMPEVPGEQNEHHTDQSTEDPKKQLSPNERQELEKQQEEQSNHYK
ncbi:YhcN/YlaJ family sporulation lipoprotein [Bacillus thermotolerans]|nr:YhcN/YlaJ family sporulation lipoprotein [Bacillus thermotolerans]